MERTEYHDGDCNESLSDKKSDHPSTRLTKEKKLTITQLKKINGFEHLSDAQALEFILSLESISIIFYDLFSLKNK